MTRTANRSHPRNALAMFVAAGAIGFLYLNFQPTPTGFHPLIGTVHGDELGSSSLGLNNAPRSSGGTTTTDNEGEPHRISGRLALRMQIAMLEEGLARLKKVSDYTATFYKQERIGTTLSDLQKINIKLRHEPFSVFMRWETVAEGREILYLADKNDGNMIVHPEGMQGRIVPSIKLDPEGTMAMRESLHPVSEVGLLELTKQLLDYRKNDLKKNNDLTCELHTNQTFDDRPCYFVVTEYQDKHDSKLYKKTIMVIDEELSLPVSVKNFVWPKDKTQLEQDTLLEHYAYTKIRMNQQLAGRDFDATNEAYHFRR